MHLLSLIFTFLGIVVAFQRRSENCGTDPAWQPTVRAYQEANTDYYLPSWWQNISAGDHLHFDQELGRRFGRHVPFDCDLTGEGSCIYPGCSDFQDRNEPPWPFMAQISVVNLYRLFKALQDGTVIGQLTYTNRITELATTFFPWHSPNFAYGDAAFWIVAAMTAILGIVPAVGPEAEAAVLGASAVGATAFIGAGIQESADQLQPESMTGFLALSALGNYSATFGETVRKNLDSWSSSVFAGEKDKLGHDITDYLKGGFYVENANLPNASNVEAFYKKQMYSRTINVQWKKKKIFTVFIKTDNQTDASGPAETKYYSKDDGGVYYTYYYQEDGILKGHLDKPWGLDKLNSSPWEISGSDISKASAGAFRKAKFNFTQEDAFELLQDSVASNGTMTPFADGAGWKGTWTLPVCDMGDIGANNWSAPYGKDGRYGKLPCCCGRNCEDTKAFVEAANMHNFQTLLRTTVVGNS